MINSFLLNIRLIALLFVHVGMFNKNIYGPNNNLICHAHKLWVVLVRSIYDWQPSKYIMDSPLEQ